MTVANGDVILGFDQLKFAKLAEKFAGPKRPPLGVLAADAEEYLAKHPEKADSIPPGTKGVYVGKVRPGTVSARAATSARSSRASPPNRGTARRKSADERVLRSRAYSPPSPSCAPGIRAAAP